MKKVLAIGDLHCGAIIGLTPPSWFISEKRDHRIAALQREMWDNYKSALRAIGDVDILIVNGDAVDGHGKKSGGSELLTTDMLSQVDIAYECLSHIKYKKAYFTHGTGYHASNDGGEDFERVLASKCNAEVYDELRLDVDGVIFDIRHHIGSSSMPSGRFTSIAKTRMWDALDAERNDRESANIYLRSHVHYYAHCGEAQWSAFTLPALQAAGTKYGARRCMGTVDWGMVCFHVDNGNLAGWDVKIYNLSNSEPEIIKA